MRNVTIRKTIVISQWLPKTVDGVGIVGRGGPNTHILHLCVLYSGQALLWWSGGIQNRHRFTFKYSYLFHVPALLHQQKIQTFRTNAKFAIALTVYLQTECQSRSTYMREEKRLLSDTAINLHIFFKTLKRTMHVTYSTQDHC